MRAFLWGLFLITILAGGHLWPKEESLWLVVAPKGDGPSSVFQILQGTTSRIVDIIDENTIIISPSANTKPSDLYKRGAFLVVNAAGYGCSLPPKNKWAKT